MRFQLLVDLFVYLVIRVVICIVQTVRIETCDWIARKLAILSYDILRIRRDVIDDNLRHAFPDWSPTQRTARARDMWQHVILLVCELVHVPRKIHETNWRNYVTLGDVRQQVTYLLDERPVVIVSGHFGNFEVGGVIAGLMGFPTFTIARPLDNPYLDRYINRFRAVTGQYILPKIGSSHAVDRVLNSGGTIMLLGDQYAGPKGCWVEFMGRPASCHKAVALLSLTRNAPLVMAYARRLGKPLQFEVGTAGIFNPLETDAEMTNVKQLTQWYSRRLEEVIRTAPDQYWWLHRRWKDTRSDKLKAKARIIHSTQGLPACHNETRKAG